MDEIVSVFITESREQLAALEAALLELESRPGDAEVLNAVFRAAHTIKGAAGVVDCRFIVSFTHVVESALDRLRNGEMDFSPKLAATLLACSDHIHRLLDVAAAEAAPDADVVSDGDAILAGLGRYGTAAPAGAVTASQAPLVASGGGEVVADCWHISLRFGAAVLRKGMEPLSFLRYLATLGRIEHLETLADALPTAAAMDPESCYLGFEISFVADVDKADIERVFDFVRDDCTVFILPPHSRLADYMALIQALPEDPLRLGEILVAIGALTEAELAQGLAVQQAAGAAVEEAADATPAHPLIGEILVDQGAVRPEVVEAAVARQKQVGARKAAEARLIRIPADKLDRLIDLVGELVIAGSGLNMLAERIGRSDLSEAVSASSRLVEGIRDAAMQLRMVEIGEVFGRFKRVVHDVSRELGKDIELVTSGGDTELDKSMVEKLGDPLMHLVRNAIDHGIEPAEVRLTRGKPARGRLTLEACHDSGSMVIEVMDDGGGLDRDKIGRKAMERGLIADATQLTDEDAYNLIFEPGFSTADAVSSLSGRGVGMDVVKRNIQSLRGHVAVSSVAGAGTRFTIRLPLTLAIIDGFLVGVGQARYVVPLGMVVECLELTAQAGGRHYLGLRGEVLPFIRLRELFELDGPPPKRESVVVVNTAGQRVGVVVDELMGELQAVIKPLGQLFRTLQGIAGSTILGSGEVALILDVQALVGLSSRGVERAAAAKAAPG